MKRLIAITKRPSKPKNTRYFDSKVKWLDFLSASPRVQYAPRGVDVNGAYAKALADIGWVRDDIDYHYMPNENVSKLSPSKAVRQLLEMDPLYIDCSAA